MAKLNDEVDKRIWDSYYERFCTPHPIDVLLNQLMFEAFDLSSKAFCKDPTRWVPIESKSLRFNPFERKPMPPSTVCDCAGTSMSIEEQLKQPWAKDVRKPIKVGNPCSYPPTIKRIDFEEDYLIHWNILHGYEVWRGCQRIGCGFTVEDAVSRIKTHSEARCLKDLEAARTAWEAEERRKKAPERLSVYADYYLKDGKYVRRDDGSSYCAGVRMEGGWRLGTDHPNTLRTVCPKEIPLDAVI